MFYLAAIGGLIGGSFFNVVAHRMPRGESLVTPGSHCPDCGTPVRPYDNVPVLGWLLLRGRCRACRQRISARYPIVEALTGLLALAVVLTRHGAHDTVFGLVLVAILVPVTLIDLDHRIIPNRIVYPAAVLAIVLGAILGPSALPEQLVSGAAAGAFLLVFALAYPRGLGMGDVKLVALLGLYLGRSVAPALMSALLVGSLVGVAIMARVGVAEGRKTAVPFGPFLALGGIVGVLAGPAIVHWYLTAVA